MNKKLKLALAALLGFSAACSTVKNTPAKGEGEQKLETGAPEVKDSVDRPRIIVMYGVRRPGQALPGTGVDIPDAQAQAQESNQLDPVAEKPVEDTPVMDTKKKKGSAPATVKSVEK